MSKKQSTQEKRGRGRPALPEGARKSVLIAIRFSKAEKELLDRAAEGNLSEWCRTVLLRAAKRSAKM